MYKKNRLLCYKKREKKNKKIDKLPSKTEDSAPSLTSTPTTPSPAKKKKKEKAASHHQEEKKSGGTNGISRNLEPETGDEYSEVAKKAVLPNTPDKGDSFRNNNNDFSMEIVANDVDYYKKLFEAAKKDEKLLNRRPVQLTDWDKTECNLCYWANGAGDTDDAYICAITPNSKEHCQFWRMVLDWNCNKIINFVHSGEEISKYYPDTAGMTRQYKIPHGKEEEITYVKITCKSKETVAGKNYLTVRL